VELGPDTEVTIVRTGGVAGVRLEATTRWGDLEEDTRAALRNAFEGGEPRPQRSVDRFTYDVIVRVARGEMRYRVGEEARGAAEAVLRAARERR
jgi:hypothetical protein